jgi:hypothetical protein
MTPPNADHVSLRTPHFCLLLPVAIANKLPRSDYAGVNFLLVLCEHCDYFIFSLAEF